MVANSSMRVPCDDRVQPGMGLGYNYEGMEEDMADQTEETKSTTRTSFKILRELLVTVALAGVAFFLIQTSLQNFQVEGSSMEETLDSGQLVLVNKLLYQRFSVGSLNKVVPFLDRDRDGMIQPFHGPSRGEVIVFRFPGAPDRKFIKRIIGVPGDVVEISRGVVILNGVQLEEAYVENRGNHTIGPRTVPEGHYWVMGDNRASSSDSRDWGPLPRENVVGKAWVTYWPLSSWGVLRTYAP